MRHHIDHLSTIWGQARIISLYEAVQAKFSNDEHQFHKIVTYKVEEKQFHYNSYYTVVRGLADYGTPLDRWKFQITCGIRFNCRGEVQPDNPLLFIRFTDPLQKMSIRAPITIGSLLETNAIYEETVVEQQVIGQIEAKSRNKAKEEYIKKMMRDLLYNQEMAEYNCVVHLVANILGIGDAYEAYSVASSIATLVMNLPREVDKNVPVAQEYIDIWQERVDRFIEQHNLGFLFLNLVNNYKQLYLNSKIFSLADLLACNNLPTQNDLEAIVLQKLQNNLHQVPMEATFFRQHLEAGIVLFNMRGIDGKRVSLVDTIQSGKYIPFIVSRNDSFAAGITVSDALGNPDVIKNIDIYDWYHLANELNLNMEEFYQVCGI